MSRFIAKHWSNLGIVGAALCAIALRFAGVLPDSKVNLLVLGAVGLLAFSGILSSIRLAHEFEELRDKLRESSLTRIIGRKDHYRRLHGAVLMANSAVRLTTTNPKLSGKALAAIPERVDYYKALVKLIRKNSNVSFKRIFGIPKEGDDRGTRIEWIREDVQRLKSCNNYHVRVIDWRDFNPVFLPLSFQLIDECCMGIATDESEPSIGSAEDLWCEDSTTVRYFIKYYEALWERAIPLKTGPHLDDAVLDTLARSSNTESSTETSSGDHK